MKRTRRYKGDRVQFCPKGHDTFIYGRNHGHCIKCFQVKHPLKSGAQPGNTNNKPKQLCPKGHNKDKTGRNKRGRCLLCGKLRQRVDPTKDSRFKQFCHNGHDTFVVGRVKGMCSICRIEYKKKYREDHKEQIREWRRNHAKELKEYAEKYHRKWYLQHMYNLTLEQHANLVESQNNTCAGCLKNSSEFKKGLFIDHDHSCCSGKRSCGKCVRGLLCDNCNRILGGCNDNVEVLQRLIKYLNKNKEK